MNPLVWKFIVEYMQSKRIDTGEYEITDPAGKKYRARQEGKETTGTKDWRIDISDPKNSPYPDDPWVYSDHARTLKDAKSHILDNFISTTPEGSPIWVELQDKIRQEALKDKSKSKGHSRYGRGIDYFNEKGIKSALVEAGRTGTRETVVSMSPDEFLKLAEKGSDPRKMERLPEGNWESIPYLHLENDAEGNARVVGHEGRHRMQRLKDVGVDEVPVTLRSLSPIWNEKNPARATRWEEGTAVPSTLTSQEGDYSIQFPWKPQWEEIQAYLTAQDPEKKKTKKLKKASKGHSRFGRGGGGYLPSDLSGSLKDDSIKSRILGHRRKPWS